MLVWSVMIGRRVMLLPLLGMFCVVAAAVAAVLSMFCVQNQQDEIDSDICSRHIMVTHVIIMVLTKVG